MTHPRSTQTRLDTRDGAALDAVVFAARMRHLEQSMARPREHPVAVALAGHWVCPASSCGDLGPRAEGSDG